MDTRLPALYISHGSPMTALNPGLTGEQLAVLARTMPKPKAIVVATAHWLSDTPSVGAAQSPATVHDFYGFPAPLYAIQYPAAGAPELAHRIAADLQAAGIDVRVDSQHGLDHGVWVPLRLLYPDADIPVIPLSIQPHLGPKHHFELGRALAHLRDEGILFIGSGSITHNLHDFRGGYSDVRHAPYVAPFISWIEEKLTGNDIEALLDYRRLAPYAERAHPTDEHFLPLYFAMGAAGTDRFDATRLDAGVDLGFLAMDIYTFDGETTAVA